MLEEDMMKWVMEKWNMSKMGLVEVEIGPEFIWESFQYTQKNDMPFEV